MLGLSDEKIDMSLSLPPRSNCYAQREYGLLMDDDVLRPAPGVEIPIDQVLLRASRSSGPGGQHANVTASRIEAVFYVAASNSLSDEQKRRVMARCGPRVTA